MLYVVLPQGLVSFHSSELLCERRFGGGWDGSRETAERILARVASVLCA